MHCTYSTEASFTVFFKNSGYLHLFGDESKASKTTHSKGCPTNKEREKNTVALHHCSCLANLQNYIIAVSENASKTKSVFFLSLQQKGARRQANTDAENDTDNKLPNVVTEKEHIQKQIRSSMLLPDDFMTATQKKR